MGWGSSQSEAHRDLSESCQDPLRVRPTVSVRKAGVAVSWAPEGLWGLRRGKLRRPVVVVASCPPQISRSCERGGRLRGRRGASPGSSPPRPRPRPRGGSGSRGPRGPRQGMPRTKGRKKAPEGPTAPSVSSVGRPRRGEAGRGEAPSGAAPARLFFLLRFPASGEAAPRAGANRLELRRDARAARRRGRRVKSVTVSGPRRAEGGREGGTD